MVLYRVGIISPNPCQNNLLGEQTILCLQEQAHHFKFFRREPHALIAGGQLARGQNQPGISVEWFLSLIRDPLQQRIDAGQQLPHIIRLKQEVIHAGFQALDAVLCFAFLQHQDDRYAAVLDPQGTGDFKGISFRQVSIENQKIIDSQFRIFFSDLSAVNRFCFQVFDLQLLLNPACECFVFRDDQDAHIYPSFTNFYSR